MQAPSIKDVAKRSGVSYKTVSRVINQEASVSEETRQRVHAAIADLEYRPHHGARSLRRGRTQAVRLVMHQRNERFLTNPFQNEIVAGIVDSAQQSGYAVMLELAGFPNAPAPPSSRIHHRSVDGTILLDSRVPSELISALAASGQPGVVVANRDVDPALGWVDADFFDGGLQMVRHLIDLGHTRIAHITDDGDLWSTQGRMRGYERALGQAGLELDPSLVIRAGQLRHEGAAATQHLLDAGKTFTAIFCVNDLTALGVIECLERNSLRVPADVSVTGYDDIYLARFSIPPLTTVRIPWYEMGARATRLLIDAIEQTGPFPVGETFPMEIILRGTTAPART